MRTSEQKNCQHTKQTRSLIKCSQQRSLIATSSEVANASVSEIFQLILTALKSSRSLNSLSPVCGFIRQNVPVLSVPSVEQIATTFYECTQAWVSRFWIIKLNHTKNPQNFSSLANKGNAPNFPSIVLPSWQTALSQNNSGFSNGFPCAFSAGGISANTTQQLALQISSNSRGFVFSIFPSLTGPTLRGGD